MLLHNWPGYEPQACYRARMPRAKREPCENNEMSSEARNCDPMGQSKKLQ